jgi:hypothetical protein
LELLLDPPELDFDPDLLREPDFDDDPLPECERDRDLERDLDRDFDRDLEGERDPERDLEPDFDLDPERSDPDFDPADLERERDLKR